MLQAMMTLMNLSWLGASSSQGTQSIILTSRWQGCFKRLSLPKNKVVCLISRSLGGQTTERYGKERVLFSSTLVWRKIRDGTQEGRENVVKGKLMEVVFPPSFHPLLVQIILFLSKEIYAFHILPLPFSQVPNHVFYRIFELKQLKYHSK